MFCCWLAANRRQFIVEGSDGRKYRLDPQTGKATRVEGEFWQLDSGVFGMNQVCSLPEGLYERGDTRKYIQRDWRDDAPRSQDDFLKPEYVCLDNWGGIAAHGGASDVDGGFLVLSSTSTESDQHKLLSLVDLETLKTRWSTPLPQTRADWADRFDKERLWRRNGKLLVANASLLLRIDPKNGRIVQTTHLVDVN